MGHLMFFLVLGASMPAHPVPRPPAVSGTAVIIDGDTLKINGQRIRLHGIDAPEAKTLWGKAATAALIAHINNQPITCTPSMLGNSLDRYKRLIAICKTGSTDLSQLLVKMGLAKAYLKYSTDYIQNQKKARKAGLGIWG